MALITDINASGASAQVARCKSSLMQVYIGGTWNGATVSLQRQLSDGTWQTVQSWTDNAYPVIETVGSASYRFSTTQGGTAPVLKCEVVFGSPNGGSVE